MKVTPFTLPDDERSISRNVNKRDSNHDELYAMNTTRSINSSNISRNNDSKNTKPITYHAYREIVVHYVLWHNITFNRRLFHVITINLPPLKDESKIFK